MAVHIHPLDIPPKYYKPIGQVAAGWNLTEALISCTLSHIHRIKDVERGRLLTYRPSAADKLRLLKVTLKQFTKDPLLKKELIVIYDRAMDLKAKRNKLCHGLWGRMPMEKIWKVFYHTEADDMILLKRDVMSLDDVKKIAAQIHALNFDLKKLMARHGVPPP